MTGVPPEQTPGLLLEQAYAHHAAACVLFARQIFPSSAEDAAQEAFIRLMGHLQRHRRLPENPRAWLLTATRSAAIDLLRSEKRRARREQEVASSAPFTAGPADRLDAADVASALASLPQRQREVMVLKIWGGLGYSEIAQMLDTAVSTAHADYRAAMVTLKQKFQAPPESKRQPSPIAGAMP